MKLEIRDRCRQHNKTLRNITNQLLGARTVIGIRTLDNRRGNEKHDFETD